MPTDSITADFVIKDDQSAQRLLAVLEAGPMKDKTKAEARTLSKEEIRELFGGD